MNNEEYLKRLHGEIIIILEEIVRICKKYDLKYYLTGGTLLGAIRHKGFIPWDDDLDIAMPRDDFEKFVTLYKELKPPFHLEWINTNDHYNLIFAKVCNENTVFEEEVYDGIVTKRGIFVDIFPLDTTNGYSRILGIRKNIVAHFAGWLFCKQFEEKLTGIKRLFVKSLSPYTFNRISCFFMKLGGKRGRYYSNFGSQYNIKRQTHLIEYYGDGLMMPFENQSYCVPCNYDAVLKSIYGNKYLDIPPLNKRRYHYPLRVVFSDGKQVEFDRVINKINVE